jgi:UDP-N-acetyl-D-mannosaminuronic acid dehydrogenase
MVRQRGVIRNSLVDGNFLPAYRVLYIKGLSGLFPMTIPIDITKKKVGMLGMGHVGLTLAASFADAGITVHGYDLKKEVRDVVASGKAHFAEKGLDALIEKHIGKTLKVVDDFKGANACDIYIVTVGTPLTANLEPDYSYLEQAGKDLGNIVKKGDLIILRSTVPLGTTRDVVLPNIEKVSGFSRGDILVAFAPERTVEGNALAELKSLPQVIGGLNDESLALASALFRTLTDHIVELPSLEEAEIVKLINNAYRETFFSFANEVSLVARGWGMNTRRVVNAANEGYARSNISGPCPGVGGYCLTKDGFLLTESAKAKGVMLNIVPQTRYVSSKMIDSIADEITRFLKDKRGSVARPTIAILGFAFKGMPSTSDMRGSMTLNLVKRLKNLRQPFTMVGFDPHVSPAKIEQAEVTAVDTLANAVSGADVVVIMNNNTAFAPITPDMFDADHPVLLFDAWESNPRENYEKTPHITYKTL